MGREHQEERACQLGLGLDLAQPFPGVSWGSLNSLVPIPTFTLSDKGHALWKGQTCGSCILQGAGILPELSALLGPCWPSPNSLSLGF